MRILVTGGEGQLAKAFAAVWGGDPADLVLLGRTGLDLGDAGSIRAALDRHSPDVVFNAGAHTQVDRCESEPEAARRLNAEAVRDIADWCIPHGAKLIQISTDYVFDGQGNRPYREEDPTSPRTVYGRTKLEGEREAERVPDHLIIRTAWLYEAWGKNFLRTMLGAAQQGRSLKVVDDQRGTPTSCRALARQIQMALAEGWCGTVHMTCRGEATWFGFASAIFRGKGLAPDLRPCTTAEYPVPAPRPAYSVLAGDKRAMMGTDIMPDWESALEEVLSDLA